MRLRFGDCLFDPTLREVQRGRERLALPPKEFQLLALLLERRPAAVPHAELRDALWPEAHVGYTSLARLVAELRRSLGDDAKTPRLVRTVSRIGYAFVAQVIAEPANDTWPLAGTLVAGRYRILSFLGGGATGRVFEAEDLRLGRRVAVKFLSPEISGVDGAVERLEREARTVAGLGHPNVCPVFHVGEEQGQVFLVQERLEGATLKHALAEGALPVERVHELGAQLADALDSAHAAGIIHLDVKPSNVLVTPRGEAKLLDFGLARFAPPAAGSIAYKAPEQARGEEVDRRSDLFSLGAVLYEMATGQPPRSAVIAGEAAEGLVERGFGRPETARLRPIVEKALSRDRSLRYQTAADLRVDLRRAQLAAWSAPAGAAATPLGFLHRLAWLGPAMILVAAVAATWWFGALAPSRRDGPRFTQLTFRRGIVTGARFSVDGHTVVYSALWDGQPPEIFARRLDSASSTSLGLPPATLLGLSSRGDLAILLAPPGERGVLWLGTLARVPLAGGPVRSLLEDVLDADWSPDGADLAVIRWRAGEFQLEYPIGKVLLRPCRAGRLRVSPRGDRIALLDESAILLVDRSGRTATLAVPPAHQRLAWSADGDALLVDAGDTDIRRTLRRVSLTGEERVVCALAGTLVVHDVSREGRVLIHHGLEHWGVRARVPGEVHERDASVFANAGVAGLSADGTQVLLWDGSQGPPGSAWLRPTTGGAAIRLGDGHAHGLSADARWVALGSTDQGRPRLQLVPTGSGEVASLEIPGTEPVRAVWLVDGRRIAFHASEAGRAERSFVVEPSGGLRALTPDGVTAIPGLMPSDTFLAAAADGSLAEYSLQGAKKRSLAWRLPSGPFAEPVRTSGDGRHLYLRRGSVPARVERIDTATGLGAPWQDLGPDDPTGIGHVWSIFITPDGRGYAYTHGLFLQDLFVVDGVM